MSVLSFCLSLIHRGFCLFHFTLSPFLSLCPLALIFVLCFFFLFFSDFSIRFFLLSRAFPIRFILSPRGNKNNIEFVLTFRNYSSADIKLLKLKCKIDIKVSCSSELCQFGFFAFFFLSFSFIFCWRSENRER
jgi:hypothetical protein